MNINNVVLLWFSGFLLACFLYLLQVVFITKLKLFHTRTFKFTTGKSANYDKPLAFPPPPRPAFPPPPPRPRTCSEEDTNENSFRGRIPRIGSNLVLSAASGTPGKKRQRVLAYREYTWSLTRPGTKVRCTWLTAWIPYMPVNSLPNHVHCTMYIHVRHTIICVNCF
jgi:hypothetical protein